MLARLYNFKFVSSGLGDASTVLIVPPTASGYLQTNLAGGKYTYLSITNGKCREIVKVVKQLYVGVFAIERAQDNTSRLPFPPGSVVQYADTGAQFSDDVAPLQIDPQGSLFWNTQGALGIRQQYAGDSINTRDIKAVLTAKGK